MEFACGRNPRMPGDLLNEPELPAAIQAANTSQLTADNELENRARLGRVLAVPDLSEKPEALVWLCNKRTGGSAREQQWRLAEDGYLEAFQLGATVLEVRHGSEASQLGAIAGTGVWMGAKDGQSESANS